MRGGTDLGRRGARWFYFHVWLALRFAKTHPTRELEYRRYIRQYPQFSIYESQIVQKSKYDSPDRSIQMGSVIGNTEDSEVEA